MWLAYLHILFCLWPTNLSMLESKLIWRKFNDEKCHDNFCLNIAHYSTFLLLLFTPSPNMYTQHKCCAGGRSPFTSMVVRGDGIQLSAHKVYNWMHWGGAIVSVRGDEYSLNCCTQSVQLKALRRGYCFNQRLEGWRAAYILCNSSWRFKGFLKHCQV